MVKVLRKNDVLISIIPDISKIKLIWKEAPLVLVKFDVMFLLLIKIQDWAIEVLVMKFAIWCGIWHFS